MDWKMPDLGEGVQEGEILKWLVKEGDKVSLDQHLVELMTDKATMEIPSSVEGVVQEIVLKEGAIAKIGQTLAVIGEEGGEKTVDRKETIDHGPQTMDQKQKEKVYGPQSIVHGPVLASPAVRQFARDKNVALNSVAGTGPGGRVLKEDVEEAIKKGTIDYGPQTMDQKQKEKVPSPLSMVHGPKEERIPLRGLRRKIAEHMALSRRTAAHFTHVDEVDMTELVMIRESAKPAATEKGVKLTYLPFIMKAVLRALQKYPILNSSLDDATHEIILKKYYNVGVAVATDDGLIVPVIKNVDSLSVLDLAREIFRLGEAARNHKLTLDELKGGTFTITNIGSIGGMFSAPIINYPEVAIMGLHQIKPTPVVKDDKIVVRQMMYISVSADHRVVDGAEVAAFVKEVIHFLEHPGAAFLELV